MRRIVLFAIILLTAAGGWYVLRGAKGLAEQNIVARLKDAGFTHAAIGEMSVGPRKTTARAVTLDRERLDTIQAIEISRGWLPLSGSDAYDITIESPDLYRQVTHINALLPAIMGLSREKIVNLPKGKFAIRNGRLSIASPLGDFQFLYTVIVDAPDDTGRRAVNATIKSDQPALDFESAWGGWIDMDGTMLVDTSLPEIKAAVGAFRLTRGNGWLSVSNAGAYPAFSGQIESGAAVLGTLPLQNFSLTLDIERNAVNILARAQASGAPQTLLSVDAIFDETTQNIDLALNSNNPDAFFTYLEQSLERPAAALKKSFAGQKNLFASVTYQPAKRFEGGPYPFDLRGALGNKEIASGTFLVYPVTFDMRGSAKIDPAHLSGITDYFKVPKDVVSGEYIRLDASLSRLFSGVGTGIVDDAGEGP